MKKTMEYKKEGQKIYKVIPATAEEVKIEVSLSDTRKEREYYAKQLQRAEADVIRLTALISQCDEVIGDE